MAERPGFTLIELLAASALTAMLCVATLRVAGVGEAPAEGVGADRAALDAAWSLLARDARAASASFGPVEAAVAWTGPAMPGPHGPAPATVRWRWVDRGGAGLLLRDWMYDPPLPVAPPAELVLAGVTGFALVPVPAAGGREAAPAAEPAERPFGADAPGFEEAPAAFAARLTLRGGASRAGLLPTGNRP